MTMNKEAFFPGSGLARLKTIFFRSDLSFGLVIQVLNISEKNKIDVYPDFPDVQVALLLML